MRDFQQYLISISQIAAARKAVYHRQPICNHVPVSMYHMPRVNALLYRYPCKTNIVVGGGYKRFPFKDNPREIVA